MLQQVREKFDLDPIAMPVDGLSVIDSKATPLVSLGVLVRSGVLGPGRPDRVAKRLMALSKFGPTLAGSFAAAAARTPKRLAVVDDVRSVTWGELNERIVRISAGLAALGVGPEGTVAMYQRNSVYAVETMVSSSRAGADALLLNTFMSTAQLTEVLQREKPKVVIVDADLRVNLTDLPEGTRVIVADPCGQPSGGETTLDDLARSTEPDLPPPSRHARLVILTSGTTGAPKGAKRGAPKGLGPAASILSRIPLRFGETILIAPPLFHTFGLAFLQIAPAVGSTIVLRRRPDPETLLEALSRHKCTSAAFVPVMLQRLLEIPEDKRRRLDTSSLRVVISSSAPLPPAVATGFQDAFGDVLHNIYGSTEVSWATIANPQDLRALPGSVGRPPIGTRLALLDDKGKPVPVGESGAIHVGNEMMFDGYTNGNDKTRVDGLMPTGDVGMISPDGLLMVLGRDDDMVIVGGENVYPMEVEDILSAHPEVREAAVIGVADEALGQRLAAYVCITAGSSLDAESVKELVKGRLGRYSIPRDVIFLAELPRNTVGKVVPRMLSASAEQQA
jgi:acyl-CoA synthetase (AMP-forming)/AMP-acid ligase II